ncbi:riboflavin synthase [Bathymodiolus platifrons methanotrophic gill symbiont]|uniref:riboflavin synthase n=1 Tax=Bathymodiolus platifrons methanotrophic gill symbiont TaxID=113268 RepID=UPI000B419B86|nr:riboflavin synthase [Bathymodiolus platifrons methanotrophic gill symbiont]MCK5870925.1 riboflavin synthase [Methyloprofundus sp.]TXK99284.1 riboflavin synthase subunit alpha [Methylococcaceae bacterium CS4]TXL00688.1 riboflavin synthase subunit alpha [Methylococcaceae bacterium CS5]TXL07425.1 riboflavin synthase subunit alpha [Methylococcaceae bacterium CS1]TXL09345.1 riboflavin synthase subunit alpha [Methylococcaceae bacterium CS3]TXL12040.1 riboflavin synthase subunit alpha [Methylococ
MFTGIILAVGKITQIEQKAGDVRLSIDTGKLSLADANLGDSIAVNGICLTAVELSEHGFVADVSNETLSRTNLKQASTGTAVNIELALTPQTRMGGHIVSGHVDGLATLIEKKPDGRSIRFKFKAPDELAKYIAEKGSICINGISLTINTVEGAVFSVNVVPHTLKETSLGFAVVGDKINLEVDLLARYMERLMKGEAAATCAAGVTEDLLKESGFL